MESLLHDLRLALRGLRRNPGFAVVAILTLALGVGANSAIFSVVYGVVFRPLPFEAPDELVRVFSVLRGTETWANSGPNFLEVDRESRTLQAVAAYDPGEMAVTGLGDARMVPSAGISASFFETLGIEPLLGRGFDAEENERAESDVVVLSHGFWQQDLGGDPEVLGRRLVLDGRSRVVVGVMPPGFAYPAGARLWTPLTYDAAFRDDENRGSYSLNVIGRLAPGRSTGEASAEFTTLARSIADRFPETSADFGLTLRSLHEATVGEIRTPLIVLLGAVGLVLLVACANVANLLLARATTRQTELAVRAALGASRRRIVRQLLTESVLLGVVGGAVGLFLAVWGTELLLALRPADVPRLHEVRVDAAVVAFGFLVSLATGLLFGIAPVWQVVRGELSATLRDGGGRGALGDRRGGRVRDVLIVAETALAVVLLAGAGILVHSFGRLVQVDPGFRTEQAAAFRLWLPSAEYPDDEDIAGFYDRLLERLNALPGVQSAAGVSALPLTGLWIRTILDIEGEAPAPAGEPRVVAARVATAGYFETAGIPVLSGRDITSEDRDGARRVVWLSASAAARYFPGEDPIGRVLELGYARDEESIGGEVVGVVGDVKLSQLQEAPQPVVYSPHAQEPFRGLDILLETAGDPVAIAAAVRRTVRDLDPDLPVVDFRTADRILSEAVSQPRFYMIVLGIFAAVALGLAAIGLFGVLSYGVAQRRREIGVRMALGANPAGVILLVVGRALALTGAGLAAGLVGALLFTRLLSGLLFGVGPTDPLTLAAIVPILAGIAMIAAYLPARRAARVEPMVALRVE